jgi:hypothetical protein
MLKVIIFSAIFLIFALVCSMQETESPQYKQNQMVGGCVMQQAGGQWIKTCG